MGFNPYPANVEKRAGGRWDLTLILLTWKIM